MQKILIILVLTLSFSNLNAQRIKKFSEDPSEYIAELENFMKINITDENKEFLEDFIVKWASDSLFNDSTQKIIIEYSNMFLKKKARPYPHFTNYLHCMILFYENERYYENFIEWKQGLDKILDSRRRTLSNLQKYLNFTVQLFKYKIINQSPSAKWKTRDSIYFFDTKEEIKVVFEETDLVCYSRFDSIEIFNTKGEYFPIEHEWKGRQGIVTFEKAGFRRDSVFANLTNFTVDCSKTSYTADSVMFTNMYFFTEPMRGKLIDKVQRIKTPESATYPKFETYQANFKITNLYENIDYEGGLTMHGAKLIGTGNEFENAKLSIYDNDTLVLKVESGYFAFRSDRINGINTSVIIKLEKDSIFHPGIDFRFGVVNKQLILSRSDKFTTNAPYYNSYHNIDMSVEQLQWKIDEPTMKLTAPMGASVGNANFESVNYFNYNNYVGMQGMDDVHPLIAIRGFSKAYGSNEFPAIEFANFIRKPIHLVKQMLMRMSVAGFVYYDTETEIATIKPKLETYIAASINKIDYDVINFPSRTNAPLENAVFDLETFDLTINGIPQIFVSDSQNVVIIPEREQIVMKKNRSFQFDGIVIAGLFTFEGKNFFFNYDSFNINLQNAYKLTIRYLTGEVDNYGLPIIEKVANPIHHVTGEILIDEPDNKSGRKSYPKYPIFKSKESSYVHYEKSDIYDGVYDQSEFYFEVVPYEMDSLDNFNKDDLHFNGEFTSAGILPPLEQKLVLKEDKSLGFVHSTPATGIPLYGGKGTFISEIELSGKGLTGSGTVKYLTSTTTSDKINLFPDSLKAIAQEFTIDRKYTETQYPYVRSENNEIVWMPYADELYAYKKGVDFRIFNDSLSLNGDLKLEPSGLSGWGRMDLKNSDISSNLFTYKANEIFADTSDFYLKSLYSEDFTVLTENVKSHINFSSRKGFFSSNEDYTLINFPENRYVSYIDNFMWDMNKTELALGSQISQTQSTTDEDELVGPTYISLHPKQDSLSFVSPLAYYNYRDNIIKATQVKYIDVADARIYPFEGNVVIETDAKMRQLVKAKVFANRNTKFHEFFDATINVYSKNSYSGLGNYNYIDENESSQIIHFNQIEVTDSIQTIASGEIYEPSNFKLSPVYSYQGKVMLEANNKNLFFDGALKIDHVCDGMESKWLKFATEIDPNDIWIPLEEKTIDINQNPIYSGIFIYYDSVHIYPTFMGRRKYHSDVNLTPSSGFLYYDKPSHLFKIASKDKILNRNTPGNYLSLQREQCELYGEGKISMGEDMGLVKLHTAGNIRHFKNLNKTNLDLVMGIDFFIHEEILDIMADELDSLPEIPPTDINRRTYNSALIEFIGQEQTDLFKNEMNLFGTVKEIPSGIKHTLVFNELRFEWNDESNSYQSIGKIGIASINNTIINKRVDGLFELQIRRSGNVMDIYLEIDPNTWYYFGYTRGVMQVLSSNKAFTDPIIALKPKKRKKRAGRGKYGLNYIYMVSTDRKARTFIRRYREIRGLDDN